MTKHKRKIVLVLSRNGSKHTLETDAKTLGELKAAAAKAGIHTEGLIWYEGLNRIFLKDDDAVLPEGGEYKGSYTTSLLFHLGRENEQHSFGADYVNDRTGEVEATFPIKRGHTLRVTKEEYGRIRIEEKVAPPDGQPQPDADIEQLPVEILNALAEAKLITKEPLKWIGTGALCAYFVDKYFPNRYDKWKIGEKIFNKKNLRQSKEMSRSYNKNERPKNYELIDRILSATR